MSNWITKLWRDSGQLSTRQLFFKYLLPFISILFSWFFLGSFCLSQLGTNSFVANKGEITNISFGLDYEPGFLSKYQHTIHPLQIALSNYTVEFRIRDNFIDDFEKLIPQMQQGDTISIYTTSQSQRIFGGHPTDVYQIKKNGKTIFPLDRMKGYNSLYALGYGLVALALWVLFYFHKKGRIN